MLSNLWLTNYWFRWLGALIFLAMLSGCQNDQGVQDRPVAKSESVTSLDKELNKSSEPLEPAPADGEKLSELPSQSPEELVASIGFADVQTEPVGIESEPIASETPAPYEPQCNIFQDPKKANLPHLTARTNFCKKVSRRLASVSMKSCLAAQLELTGCRSVKGDPLMVREYPPVLDREPLGKVLLIGGTHGDELTSVSITFRWLETLNKHHSGLFHWRVIPVLNPDGLLQRAAQRTNHNGVDLNRNLPSKDWYKNAIDYWNTKGNKSPRKYPGTEPNSEPENQWLVDEIHLFKPDAIISIHAPYGVVDFDAHKLNTAPKSLGKLRLNLLVTYPGSLGNFAGIDLNIPVITLELPHAWEMPSSKESELIWEDIVQWLKKNLNNDELSTMAE